LSNSLCSISLGFPSEMRSADDSARNSSDSLSSALRRGSAGRSATARTMSLPSSTKGWRDQVSLTGRPCTSIGRVMKEGGSGWSNAVHSWSSGPWRREEIPLPSTVPLSLWRNRCRGGLTMCTSPSRE